MMSTNRTIKRPRAKQISGGTGVVVFAKLRLFSSHTKVEFPGLEIIEQATP
jgi:hypothetical protein